MPTYNRLQQLRQVLAGLEAQTHPLANFEVIIVSDGSTDGTDAYLATLQTPLTVVPVTQANAGPAAARNRGVAAARSELVLFLDDDVVPTPGLVSEHLRMHEQHGDRVVVLGPMLIPDDFYLSPWVRWEQKMLEKQYGDMLGGKWTPTARQFYTGNASLRRQHLLDAGGFDPAFRRAEDVELAYRLADAGLGFVFTPEAVGYHYARRSFASWLKTPYLYGRNDVIFTRDKGQTWLLPNIFEEFHGRHPLIRALTRLSLSRALLRRPLIGLLVFIATAGNRLGLERVARHAYSGIFNLLHYQGVADELGGRRQFFQRVTQADASPQNNVQQEVVV